MSDRVLHEWSSAFTGVPMRMIQDDDGGPPLVQFQLGDEWITTPFEQTAIAARAEFARLAAENASLRAAADKAYADGVRSGARQVVLRLNDSIHRGARYDIIAQKITDAANNPFAFGLNFRRSELDKP